LNIFTFDEGISSIFENLGNVFIDGCIFSCDQLFYSLFIFDVVLD